MNRKLVIQLLRDLSSGVPLEQVVASLGGDLLEGKTRAALLEAAQALEGGQQFNDAWLLTEIVEHIPEMVFVKEAHSLRFVRVNAAAENLLGIAREEMLGKTDFDFFPPEEAQFFQTKDREVLQQGKLLDISQEEILTRGGLRYLNTKKIPILGDDGQPRFLVGLSRDITAMKLAQEELARSQRELRRLSSQLQQAQEEERLRLAHELHDELGQVLTGLKIELAWIEERVAEGHRNLGNHLTQTQNLVDVALAHVRRVATALRPQILDDLGLRAALDWLAQGMCERACVQPNLEFNLLHQVDKEMAITIFRICQDALTNVARDASAHKVWIRLKEEDHQIIQLEIADDRPAPQRDLQEGSSEAPLGLNFVGIRERAQLRGGTVHLGVDPERGGTRLTVRLPSVWN